MKFPASLSLTVSLIALILFLSWQTYLSFELRAGLRNSLKNQQGLVGQSQQIQGSATRLLSDLIDLSERNANARAIVQKYGIARTAPVSQ